MEINFALHEFSPWKRYLKLLLNINKEEPSIVLKVPHYLLFVSECIGMRLSEHTHIVNRGSWESSNLICSWVKCFTNRIFHFYTYPCTSIYINFFTAFTIHTNFASNEESLFSIINISIWDCLHAAQSSINVWISSTSEILHNTALHVMHFWNSLQFDLNSKMCNCSEWSIIVQQTKMSIIFHYELITFFFINFNHAIFNFDAILNTSHHFWISLNLPAFLGSFPFVNRH